LNVVESATTAAAPEIRAPAWKLARVHSAVLWGLFGIVAIGVGIRFSTLGLQSYHHDEVITAGRVLPGSFIHMLREVRASESNPPLYYVLAWGWSKLFGTGEVGLRSLSALFGAATIPVAYLIGKELLSRRAGLITAALVAVNPMLIWYSQEARSYSLLVLLCAASLLFFLRARSSGDPWELALWSLFSALALSSHYFAVFPVAIEAAWLLVATRFRFGVLFAVAGVAAMGLLLAPLALSQINPHHIGWISASPLPIRAAHTAASFMIGETGRVIGHNPRDGYALIPGAIAVLALGFALLAAGSRGRRAAAVGLLVGGGSVLLAVAAALAGKDYVIGRNLLPALVPLLAVVGIGLGALRFRRVGLVIATLLCAYWIAFDVHVDLTPSLQRPDWRDLAQKIDTSGQARAVVTWKLAADPLEFYMHNDAQRVYSGRVRAREIDVVAKPRAARSLSGLPADFHRAGWATEGRLTLVRYRAPQARTLHFSRLDRLRTGFGVNAILIDGGPGEARTALIANSLRKPV
jgi:mannosyltransferase